MYFLCNLDFKKKTLFNIKLCVFFFFRLWTFYVLYHCAAVDDVVAILDMDGFHIKNKFRCKELGMLVLEEEPVILSMTGKDWKQHDYI